MFVCGWPEKGMPRAKTSISCWEKEKIELGRGTRGKEKDGAFFDDPEGERTLKELDQDVPAGFFFRGRKCPAAAYAKKKEREKGFVPTLSRPITNVASIRHKKEARQRLAERCKRGKGKEKRRPSAWQEKRRHHPATSTSHLSTSRRGGNTRRGYLYPRKRRGKKMRRKKKATYRGKKGLFPSRGKKKERDRFRQQKGKTRTECRSLQASVNASEKERG